ncbi:MAG: hypothetical protein AAF658_02210 [Myxococcota bacterium]
MNLSVDDYLAQLPGGPEAFSECLSTVEVSLLIRDRMRDAGLVPASKLLAPLFAGDYDNQKYVPEVLGVALQHAYRELAFDRDEAFLQEMRAVNGHVFQSPVYRALMKLLSPSLVVLGAGKRWRAFHTHGELKVNPVNVETGRKAVAAQLVSPAHLYTELYLHSTAAAFIAAVSLTGAADVRVELTEWSETGGHYQCSWAS